MAKRIGANGRKKKAGRGVKLPKAGRTIAIGVAIAALAAGAGAVLLRTGTDRIVASITGVFHKDALVTDLSVSGGSHATKQSVMAQCGLHFPMSYREFDRICRRELPARNAWVESVKVSRNGGTALVTVSERKPVALFARGEVMLVDTLGFLMPLSQGVPAALPLVTGLADSAAGAIRVLTHENCERMNRFLAAAGTISPALSGRIAQVQFTNDGIANISVEGCSAVIAVEEKNAAERLQRLAQVFGSIERDSLAPTRIDLSYRNLAFVTTEFAGEPAKREKTL